MSDFKCDKCKKDIDIHDHELYELYNENNHKVDCPYCQEKIHVNAVVDYHFVVTDEDGDEIY